MVKCPSCGQPFDDKDLFAVLIGRFSSLFAVHRLPVFTILYAPDQAEKRAKNLAQEKYGPTDPKVTTAVHIARELYWSFADIQMSLLYLLWTRRVGRLVKGRPRARMTSISVPQYQLPDFFFWHHVNNAWENLFRVWSRIENLANLFFFDVAPGPGSEGRPIGRILTSIEQAYPKSASVNGFRALSRVAKWRNRVAEKHNELSHEKSSLFSRERFDVTESPLFRTLMEPFVSIEAEWPDPTAEVKRIERHYKTLINAFMWVYELIEHHVSILRIR